MSSNPAKADRYREPLFSYVYVGRPNHPVHINPNVSTARKTAALCACLLKWNSRIDGKLMLLIGSVVLSRALVASFSGETARFYHVLSTLAEPCHWPSAAYLLLKIAHRGLIGYLYRGHIEL